MYRGRHSRQTLDSTPTGTVTTNPFDPNREIIQRVRFVFDQILGMIPDGANKDLRFTAMKTMMYESLKDLARIPDETIIMMTSDMANALNFVAQGSMEAVLNAGDQRDNSEEG